MLQIILAGVLGLFFVPAGLFNLADALFRGGGLVPLAVGLMSLAVFGAIYWVVLRAHLRSVKHFSEEGLVRNDGRTFLWADLDRVVYQMTRNRTYGSKRLWRTEIHFKSGGVAWLLPLKVGNSAEVSEYVRALPCEHTEMNV